MERLNQGTTLVRKNAEVLWVVRKEKFRFVPAAWQNATCNHEIMFAETSIAIEPLLGTLVNVIWNAPLTISARETLGGG
jgi:hypothetical protein